MLQDEYKKAIDYLENTILKQFRGDLKLISKSVLMTDLRFLKLVFKYTPCEYIIEYDVSYGLFAVNIYDTDGCSNTLQRIKSFKNSFTNILDIKNSIEILYQILLNNNIEFYSFKDGKVYLKKDGQFQRIKDFKKYLEQVRGGKHE